MADSTELRGVPVNVSPDLAGFLNDLRRLAMKNAKQLDVITDVQQTLNDLLKGAAPTPTPGRGFRLPPVTGFTINKLPNSIEFVLTPIKVPTVYPPITDVNISLPNKRTQLWRAFSNENALNAEFVKETDSLGLADHPPPGVKYRYWLRYVTDIESQAGPFSPVEGIEFTADEVANPEDQFNPSSGGVFLETFEDQNVPDRWSEQEPLLNLPTISYPAQGVVGGIVAQFAGDEAWRVHNDLIPYDPATLYRFRIGVRFTVAPTNLAKMKFFAGVQCVAADGVTLINAVGANTYSSQHYVAASGADLITGGINNWQTFTGYFSGIGTTALPAPSIASPSPLFPGTKYFKPLFIVNYDDGDGTAQVDFVRVEALDPLDVALTGSCIPDSIVVNANSLKIVLSYANATGTFEVRYGSIVLNGATTVAFSILSNPQALFASINSAGAYSITGGFDLAEDTASITFRAIFNGVNVDRTVQLTKSLQGGPGWTPTIETDTGGVPIVINGASLTKVGGIGNWDSSVYSLEAYTQGAVVSARAGQTTGHAMFGLNSDPTSDANYISLDYAWYIQPGGALDIYESGVGQGGGFGGYTTSDVLLVSYDGETVRYWKNSTLMRSVLAPGRSLSFDSSFYTPGVQLLDVNFNSQGPVANSNRFAVTGTAKYSGSTIEKVGGSNGYNSSVYSLDGYPACFISFTPQVPEMQIGLNTDPQLDDSYTSIDFAWGVQPSNGLNIYESGVGIVIGTWTTSTVLSITYDGQYVRYLKDNVVVRQVLFPGRVLYMDAALYAVGTKAANLQFGASGVVGNGASAFIARGNCVVVNDTIEKVGGSFSWDSDVYSREGYTEGAFASARGSQNNKYLMFGLNSDPTTDSSYSSIDYAWYLRGDGACQVYENASGVGDFGTYTSSTVFAVRHVGALVQYIKDGVVVRSVARTATTPLFFDCSIDDPGGRLEDVHFGPAGKGAEADPSAVYLETFESPWETTFTNYSNASNMVATYPNDGQFGGKVLSAQRKLYIYSNELIPFDSTALYRISTRIRRTVAGAGTDQHVYCGAWGVAADGVTWSVQPWNCADNFDMSAVSVNTWKDFVGFFKGIGSDISSVSTINDSPKNMASGTTFLRPALVLNYAAGTGTMEVDFIKIERLVNPNDADNSDKNRVIPDAEFQLATDDTYWYRSPSGTVASTTAPVISTTGGAVAGKVTLATSGSFSPVRVASIVSRRRVPIQVGTGQLYTATIRWRRTGTVDGGSNATFLTMSMVRHNQLPTSSSFSLSSVLYLAGGVLRGSDLDAMTVNQWNETSMILFVPRTSSAANAAFPYMSALLQWTNSVARTIEVDYFSVLPGVSCDPFVSEVTSTSWGLLNFDVYKKHNYNNASPGTIILPTLTDDSLKGAKIYFEQIGAGLLTIAVDATNTLQSAPNTTGSRSLTGRYARAFAECIDATTWRLVGQLA